MRLEWLELIDFRSYLTLRFEPEPGVNVLVGDNGSGKTSVLEAIGYLASLKSFRRAPDSSLVREGADGAITRGAFASKTGETLVEVETPIAGRRTVLVNGKRVQSRAELVATVALVAFLPDDLDLIKRGPAYRREFLDDLAAQLWPAAGADQNDFDRALRQRNALLRREGRHADPTTLDVLDDRVARLGAAVLARRLKTLEMVAPVVETLYADLGETPATLDWKYEAAGIDVIAANPTEAQLAESLAHAILEARRSDMERRTTTVGPHRDEIVFRLDGRDARTRASQGEQRSIALGLRIASFQMIVEQRDVVPVLLLDDVFSELDPGRSEKLVARLPEGQIFVTSARDEEVPVVGKRWNVAGGKVTPS